MGREGVGAVLTYPCVVVYFSKSEYFDGEAVMKPSIDVYIL